MLLRAASYIIYYCLQVHKECVCYGDPIIIAQIIIIMMSYHFSCINDQDDLVATLGSSQNNYKSFLICCDNRVVVTSIERLDRILGSPIRESKIYSRANLCSKLCGQTFIERVKCRLYRWKPRRVVCLQTISYFRLSYLCTNNTEYSSYIL